MLIEERYNLHNCDIGLQDLVINEEAPKEEREVPKKKKKKRAKEPKDSRFERLLVEFFGRFCRLNNSNIIDVGKTTRTLGFSAHESSEIRNVLMALQFMRNIKEENGKSDMYELLSLNRMTEIVQRVEESKQQFDPPKIEGQTSQMDMTFKLLRALLGSS